VRYLFLLFLKAVSHTFYRHDTRWVAPPPPPPWDDLRLLAFIHHTSLFEWLFVAAAPNHLLKRIATRGLVPIAQSTYERPFVGRFYNVLAPGFVPISREPDHTWQEVMRRVDPNSMVVIAPEGRMMRANGLDKNGMPMTIRGGIADILRAIDGGRMLLAYSGGLHHVQVPGQHIPKLFREVRMELEMLDIDDYKRSLGVDPAEKGFKNAVKRDLERRRDALRPPLPPAPWPK
jgi:hypothetical protein